MEVQEQIAKFQELIENEYKNYLLEQIKKDNKFLLIDFSKVIMHDLNLADDLLENPEEVIKAADIAVESFDTLGDVRNFKVRFQNLPKTQERHIWEIRSSDVGKFISIKGNISKVSGLLHLCYSAKWECSSCGSIINTIYHDRQFKQPNKCGCGRTKAFRLINKEMLDTLKFGVSDDLLDEDNKVRKVSREKIAIAENDLVTKEMDSKYYNGRKVKVNGYLQYIKKEDKSVEFVSEFKVNSIEFIEVGWDTVPITKEEEEEIEELSKDPNIIKRLANSVADVHGYDFVKVACMLQLAGAPSKYDSNDDLSSRGTIHVLLIGNPGTSKTYMAKRFGKISPIYSFQSSSNASGKGLVAAVDKDKDLGYVLVPGVVAICNKGLAVIDEIDKTNPEDYGDHNNAMNDMKVYIAKATVKAILDTETSYLATANPENRIFTDYKPYIEQIAMPKDFIDRFDLICPMISSKEKEHKERIIDIMLDRHVSEDKEDNKIWKPEFSHEFIRKYIASCRRLKPNPKLKKEDKEYIKTKILEMMKPRDEEHFEISNRQIESIMRFTASAARLRRKDIDKECIDLAFNLKKETLKLLKIIDDEGRYNWGIEEHIDEGKISNQQIVETTIKELEKKLGKTIPIDDVISECEIKGMEKEDVEKMIEKIKRKGDIFEPRRGFLSRL